LYLARTAAAEKSKETDTEQAIAFFQKRKKKSNGTETSFPNSKLSTPAAKSVNSEGI
jgi:hypothetical protein